jgi:hypothetical protein
MSNAKFGPCPQCNGTGRWHDESHPQCGSMLNYGRRNGWYGYDAETDTVDCYNCGGQKMSCTPTGQVRLRGDGTPCLHEYKGANAGRCLITYTCLLCGDRYQIDSGD